VLEQLDIRFLREMHWPGTVEIGTATTRIGRSSYTFLQAIFHEGQCAATADATMVMIDVATRKACPLPPQVIARLEELRLKA
jgi:acyl-CoA thioester hydrolase